MILTSDLHFWHTKVLEFCAEQRPWLSVEEMNEALISLWNKSVTKKNTKVYHLGDFSFGLPEQTEQVVSRLNGDKVFLVGNHDHSRTREVLARYGQVKYYDEIKYNKHLFVASHYPFLDWNKKKNGSIHVHGHMHGNIKHTEQDRGKTIDVGYDANGKLLHFDEVIEMMQTREIFPMGHH